MTVKFLSPVAHLITITPVILGLALITSPKIYAHSGRTDANGGHNCYVGACAGTYHYHNGGGGSSSSAPSTPNYIDLGLANGKAHAVREAENIRTQTRDAAYHAGEAAGQSGNSKGLMIPPSHICDVNFNFDAGTSQTYQSWYKTGWSNECNSIARSAYEPSYDAGYVKGAETKAAAVAAAESTRKASDNSSNDGWIWAILGAFVGLPILAGMLSPSKKK